MAKVGVRLANEPPMMRLKNKVSGLMFEARRRGAAVSSLPDWLRQGHHIY